MKRASLIAFVLAVAGCGVPSAEEPKVETPAPIVAAPVTPHVSRVRTNTIILDDCDPPHTVPLLPGDPLPEGTIEPGDGPPEGTIEPTDPPDGNSIQPTDPPDGVIAPNVIHVHGHVEQ